MSYQCFYCNKEFNPEEVPKITTVYGMLASSEHIDCKDCKVSYFVTPTDSGWKLNQFSFIMNEKYMFIVSFVTRKGTLYTVKESTDQLIKVLSIPTSKFLHLSKDKLINKIKTIMVFS